MGELFALSETGALEETEKIEFAFGLHLVQHVIFRKVLYSEYNIAGAVVECPG